MHKPLKKDYFNLKTEKELKNYFHQRIQSDLALYIFAYPRKKSPKCLVRHFLYNRHEMEVFQSWYNVVYNVCIGLLRMYIVQ